jgi:hypothetical protein
MSVFRKVREVSLDPSPRSVVLEAVASIVRSASAAAFAAQVFAVTATFGSTNWAVWRRLGLGWRFWMGLGSWSAFLAFACLGTCLLLAAFRRWCREQELKDTSWCAWLNITTIALLFFIPAIAAV